jgi:hypothetical protein
MEFMIDDRIRKPIAKRHTIKPLFFRHITVAPSSNREGFRSGCGKSRNCGVEQGEKGLKGMAIATGGPARQRHSLHVGDVRATDKRVDEVAPISEGSWVSGNGRVKRDEAHH